MIGAWLVSAALAAPVDPDAVVAAALSRHPALAEAEAAVLAAIGEQRAATGLRYDPTLAARLGFGLQQHEAALTQPLSLSGEGLAAAKAADAARTAAEATRERTRLEVAADARRALICAIAADGEVARATEVLGLARALRTAAEARLAAGQAPAFDVHLAHLEEAAAAAEVARARRDAQGARERLAAITGLARDVELPADPMVAAPTDTGPPGGARSDRVAAWARVTQASAAVQRERAAVLPPVALGVWAQVQTVAATPGAGGVTLAPGSWSEVAAWTAGPSLSVTVPVWRANRDAIARAIGARDQADAARVALDAQIAAEQAGSADRRAAIALVAATADPTSSARAALAGVDAAIAAGERGAADGALLRTHILDAWRRASSARANAAEIAVDLALTESWTSLLPTPP